MTLKQVAGKSLIYDSTDDNFYANHSIRLEGDETFIFSPTDLTRLEALEKSENKSLLNFILSSFPGIYRFAPIPELFGYKNEDELSVRFKETERYIGIISLGESQPGRYKIYVEGVFEKTPSNLSE